MRSVNLIPPDARRGDGTKMRTGGVPYVILGALALLLLGVVATAFTSKQVSDKQNEVASLQQELEAKTAKAQSLAAFSEFGAVEEMRSTTVASLAQSRFDWERVLNEMALIIPSDVWLTQLSGTVNPSVTLEEAPEVEIRDGISGPALEIIGCAKGQDAVAGFVADLEDIDGVTRVGVESSELPDEEETGGGAAEETSGSNEGDSEECRTENFIAKFAIAVAFDQVPAPGTATSAPGVPGPLANSFSEVAGQQAQQAANQAEVAQGSAQAADAANVLPGG
jgi:Tfp pilus assembly protein PilN